MKKLIVMVLSGLILVGCSGGKETTTVCSIEDGVDTFADTMVAKGDKVTESTVASVSDFKIEMEEDDMTSEDLEMIFELVKADYANLDGVKYFYEVTGSIVTETLIFDYSKTSLKDLYEADLLDIPDADYISLEETTKSYESQGLTCVVE